MSYYDSKSFRPEVRARLDPYRPKLDAAAAQHGVPPDLMYGTIAAESSGQADARGDGGVAQGIWQVQTPFVRDWLGNGPDVRLDPVAATQRIMPAFRKNLDTAGGDWALATVGYMRGTGSKEYQRIKAGEDPATVLADKGWVLARYKSMKALQAKRGGAPAPTPPRNVPQEQRQLEAMQQAQLTAQAQQANGLSALGIGGGTMTGPGYQPVQGLVGGAGLLGITAFG